VNKKLLKVAITTALATAFAVPAFANPFSDVPADHWAYDAVSSLAQAGVIEGYEDGTFRGNKTMTRYEMAQIVAKAMTKELNADQQATVDELSQEFATELNSLGVKVAGLEKQMKDMVKVSGDARVRYGAIEDGGDKTDFRARITVDGKISDNLAFSTRVTSGNVGYKDTAKGIELDTANVTFNALGLKNTIGLQDVKLGSGFLMDTQATGIATQAGGLKLAYANAEANSQDDRIFAAEYSAKAFGAKVTADYLNIEDGDEFYGIGTTFALADNIDAVVEYTKNDTADADAIAYGVKFNKLGLSATYRDVETAAISGYSNVLSDIQALNQGFKGMEYQFDKALDKNTTLTVKYQDFELADGSDSNRTSAYVNVKF